MRLSPNQLRALLDAFEGRPVPHGVTARALLDRGLITNTRNITEVGRVRVRAALNATPCDGGAR